MKYGVVVLVLPILIVKGCLLFIVQGGPEEKHLEVIFLLLPPF